MRVAMESPLRLAAIIIAIIILLVLVINAFRTLGSGGFERYNLLDKFGSLMKVN